MNNFQDKANFIWQVADDILRGTFKQHEYGDTILPFVVLRRLDCLFEDRKDDVIETYKKFKKVSSRRISGWLSITFYLIKKQNLLLQKVRLKIPHHTLKEVWRT